jgi:two-component system sensor histidine kinase KdpD
LGRGLAGYAVAAVGCLRVADRGPGVPLADRDWMFAPFERLADTRDPTGLGLRLTLARGTLEPEMTPGAALTGRVSAGPLSLRRLARADCDHRASVLSKVAGS